MGAAASIQHSCLAGATVIANPSASNETIGKAEYRRQLVLSQSARLVSGYVYADAGADESTTDLVFSGHNLIAENGALLAQSEPFSQGLLISELDVDRLEEERRRQSTYPAADTQGFTLVPFDLPLQAATLTRRIDPSPFVPGDAQQRAQRCESIFAIQAMGLKAHGPYPLPPGCYRHIRRAGFLPCPAGFCPGHGSSGASPI